MARARGDPAPAPPAVAPRSPGRGRTLASVPLTVWAVGLAGALVACGPALGPGSLLNLDLLVVSDPPVPSGMWGLGLELPRRVPLWGPLAWASRLLGGELVGKALLVAVLVVAFVGAWRLTARLGRSSAEGSAAVGPWVAGVFYGFGPFLATRTAVGHLLVSLVMALLPWAAVDLLQPFRRRSSALLWCVALGLGGVFGGLVAGACLINGAVVDRAEWRSRPRRLLVGAGLFLVTQLPWLVPLAVVSFGADGRSLARASDFAPAFGSLGDAGRFVAGEGFWNGAFQVGRDLPVLSALAGAVLLAAAVVGTSRLPDRCRVPVTALAAVSFAVAVASAVPGLSGAVDAVSGSVLGAPLRDSQRALVPFLLWLAVTAGLGADRILARRPHHRAAGAALAAAGVLPLAAAIVLAVPSAWGFGGQLRPVRLAPEWAEARAAVEAEPGPVLALPWFQYYTADVARDRLTLGIAPYYFGGDVLAASDPRLGGEQRVEVGDPRYATVEPVVEVARAGGSPSAALAAAGVRWVVLQHEVDWTAYTGLARDPGLELVVSGSQLDLYRVSGWRGPVVGDDGSLPSTTEVVGPLLLVERSGTAILDRPYQPGWMRGLSPAGRSDEGLVRLPSGSGPVWYWPAVLVLLGDAACLLLVAVLVHQRWGRGHAARAVGEARTDP